MKNRDHYADFVVGEDYERYIARKRRPHEHGNHLEIQAMSEMFSRRIEVYENSDGGASVCVEWGVFVWGVFCMLW